MLLLRAAVCIGVAGFPLSAQVWAPVQKRAAAYRAFPDRRPPRNALYPFYLEVPATTQLTEDSMCRPGSSPYEWWRWLAGDAVSATPVRVWSGPSREFQRDPGMLYLTPARRMAGLEFTGAFAGEVAANTDPDQANKKNAITQAFFAHTRTCYDGGVELGFYRRLATPMTPSESRHILFYYSDINNCTGVAGGYLNSVGGRFVQQTSCKVKADGSFVSQTQTPMISIPIPAGKNSKGGPDWTYRAWAVDAATLRVEVRDPHSNAVAWSANARVADFFKPYVQQMLAGQFRANLTLTIQKTIDRDVALRNRGDVVPDAQNPPVIGVRSMGVAEPASTVEKR